MTQEIQKIKITSELFGVLELPSLIGVNDTEHPLDVWTSIGDHMDINVFDVGEGTTQATIYPVKDGSINTLHIIESLQGDNIEFIYHEN